MSRPDLNLLVTLDVLLAEGSVARAARRLRLSPSAMSRALARLRETTGDPLLVRAGRGLVPTPRALELRGRVSQLVLDGEAVLRPAGKLDPGQLVRTFTLRTSEGFVENFGPDLIARVGEEAPGVRLRFVHKPDKDSAPLRDGIIDLETGVVGQAMGPEVRAQALFRDRFIGVVRQGQVNRRVVRVEEDKHGHLLKGILVCGHCGTALTPHPAGKKGPDGKPYLYYECTNVAKHGSKSDCGVRNLSARKIEELVVAVLGEMGKHPEVIEKTVGTLRRSAQAEIGPLREGIAKRSKEIGELQRREEQLAKRAAEPEVGGFGASLMRQGREIADQRELLERERAVLQAQVSMKEVGLVEAEKVADQLRGFHELMGEMSADDQKEIVRLMLKEVRVNRFDPEKQRGELGDTEIPLKIRTEWFALNVTFFSNELFSRALRESVKQFVSRQEWLPGLGSNQ